MKRGLLALLLLAGCHSATQQPYYVVTMSSPRPVGQAPPYYAFTARLDFGDIEAGSCKQIPMFVPSNNGDPIVVGASDIPVNSQNWASVIISGFIISQNTAMIRLCNATSGTVHVPAGEFSAIAFPLGLQTVTR